MGFFKAYDMRGTYGVDFGLDTVARVGQALPRVLDAKRWLVGRDCRTTSADVREALVRGLHQAGAEVVDLGLCSTPMVYFFTARGDFDGSVMITASHNPPGDNGLKVSKRGALPVGYANGLDEVEKLVPEMLPREECPLQEAEPLAAGASPLEEYVAWQKAAVDVSAFSSLDYAVDCSSGMASLFARRMFPGAHLLNDTLDGTFSAHSPNPLKAEAREAAAAFVREKHLDCAVIFDGDADRAMFVDECGRFVQPDYLIPIVAQASGVKPGDKVIHDIRTSRGAIEAIRELGAEPVMVPVGHAFAKPILRSTGALCGGELAGHYYFREFCCCDSGLLAATRILSHFASYKARTGGTFSGMMAGICGRYANSGEINFRVTDKKAATAAALAAAKEKIAGEAEVSTIDGIRMDYADGWFNIRESNTEPYLRLVAECRTKEMLSRWLETLTSPIRSFQQP